MPPPPLESPLFWVACVLGGVLTAVSFCRPFFGACVLMVLHPCSSVYLDITRGDSRLLVLPFAMASALLVPVLLVRGAAQFENAARRRARPLMLPATRVVLVCMAFFACWSLYSLHWSGHAGFTIAGLTRLLLNFSAALYLAVFVGSLRQVNILFALVCAVALLFVAAAVLATHFAAEWSLPLPGLLPEASAEFTAALFNQAGGYNPLVVGMLTGYGLGGKHELGMLMLAGSISALYLATQTTSRPIRLVLGLTVLLCFGIIYQAMVKLTLGAALFLAAAATLAFPKWRRWFPAAMLAFFAVNIAGLLAAGFLRTEHMKNMESTTARFAVSVESGKFTTGSFSERLHIQGEALRRAADAGWIGRGPDSLARDMTFGYNHGHNFFLTLAAEYGLPGVLSVVVMLAAALAGAWRLLRHSALPPAWWLPLLAATLLLLGALFESMLDVFVWMPAVWVMLGLLLANIKLATARLNMPTTENAARLSPAPAGQLASAT